MLSYSHHKKEAKKIDFLMMVHFLICENRRDRQNGKIYLLDKEDTASFKALQQLMYAVQVL